MEERGIWARSLFGMEGFCCSAHLFLASSAVGWVVAVVVVVTLCCQSLAIKI